VLEAAAGLLAEGASFADLSVERIATRAGISRTAFYFYFRDKRELLMRLTEDVADELYAVAEGWWSGAGDGRADLDRTIRAILAVYEAQGALLRAVVQSAGYDEPVAAFWRALMGRFVDATERRITAEVEAGLAQPMPARGTATALVWMTERHCYQALAQGIDLRAPEFADALVGVWLRAVYGRLG